jgi:hypothetical protein
VAVATIAKSRKFGRNKYPTEFGIRPAANIWKTRKIILNIILTR